jgi:hypothetical protein
VHDEGKSVRRIFVRGSNLGIRAVAVAVLMLGLVGGLIAGTQNSKADTLTATAAVEPAAVATAPDAPSVTEQQVERDAKTYVAAVRQSASAHAYAVTQARAKAKAAAARAEAAAAAAEADRKARAERASRSSSRSLASSGTPGGNAPAVPVDCKSYSGNKAVGCSLLGWAGFATSQMSCLEPLWSRESGWNETAGNQSSGAYGIPQALPGSKMAEYGSDWKTNPVVQVKWGLQYIKGRYGTPCDAWSAFRSKGWY